MINLLTNNQVYKRNLSLINSLRTLLFPESYCHSALQCKHSMEIPLVTITAPVFSVIFRFYRIDAMLQYFVKWRDLLISKFHIKVEHSLKP